MAKKWGEQVAGIGCLLFCTVFWSGLTLTLDNMMGKATFQQVRALSHPTATGTIIFSEVEVSHDGDGVTYRPSIRYTYSVDGKQFAGNRYRYGQMGTNDRSAHRIVASYPVGMQVEVHHDPNDPADAVLRAGLEGADLFGLMFMLPFNLAMLVLWAAVCRALYYRTTEPLAGGAKVMEEGRCLRVRLSPGKPLLVGIGASGKLAFVLIFVIGFGFGFSPPLGVMLVAWGLIIGGGGAAGLYNQRKVARGDSDLILDDFRQSIVLPRTFGRREQVVIPLGSITSIEVERIEKRHSEGESIRHSYIPTVTFTDGDGAQCREKLIEWRDETSAEGLAEWLSERLRVKPSSEIGGVDDRPSPRT